MEMVLNVPVCRIKISPEYAAVCGTLGDVFYHWRAAILKRIAEDEEAPPWKSPEWVRHYQSEWPAREATDARS